MALLIIKSNLEGIQRRIYQSRNFLDTKVHTKSQIDFLCHLKETQGNVS